MPFKNKLLTEYPVAVKIAGRLEFRQDRIVRLIVADRVD